MPPLETLDAPDQPRQAFAEEPTQGRPTVEALDALDRPAPRPSGGLTVQTLDALDRPVAAPEPEVPAWARGTIYTQPRPIGSEEIPPGAAGTFYALPPRATAPAETPARLGQPRVAYHVAPAAAAPAVVAPVAQPAPAVVAPVTRPVPAVARPLGGMPAALGDLVRRVAGEVGISDALLRAVMHRENARYDPTVRGRQGEVGLGQIKPETAGLSAQALEDPETNLRASAGHLRDLLQRYRGDMEKALAAWNAGPLRVRQAEMAARALGGTWRDHLVPAAQRYVTGVLDLYAREAEALGPSAGARITMEPSRTTLAQRLAREAEPAVEARAARTQALVLTPETRQAILEGRETVGVPGLTSLLPLGTERESPAEAARGPEEPREAAAQGPPPTEGRTATEAAPAAPEEALAPSAEASEEEAVQAPPEPTVPIQMDVAQLAAGPLGQAAALATPAGRRAVMAGRATVPLGLAATLIQPQPEAAIASSEEAATRPERIRGERPREAMSRGLARSLVATGAIADMRARALREPDPALRDYGRRTADYLAAQGELPPGVSPTIASEAIAQIVQYATDLPAYLAMGGPVGVAARFAIIDALRSAGHDYAQTGTVDVRRALLEATTGAALGGVLGVPESALLGAGLLMVGSPILKQGRLPTVEDLQDQVGLGALLILTRGTPALAGRLGQPSKTRQATEATVDALREGERAAAKLDPGTLTAGASYAIRRSGLRRTALLDGDIVVYNPDMLSRATEVPPPGLPDYIRSEFQAGRGAAILGAGPGRGARAAPGPIAPSLPAAPGEVQAEAPPAPRKARAEPPAGAPPEARPARAVAPAPAAPAAAAPTTREGLVPEAQRGSLLAELNSGEWWMDPSLREEDLGRARTALTRFQESGDLPALEAQAGDLAPVARVAARLGLRPPPPEPVRPVSYRGRLIEVAEPPESAPAGPVAPVQATAEPARPAVTAAPPTPPEPQPAASVGETEPAPPPPRVTELPLTDLHVDPDRFQYKIEGRQKSGATGTLTDVARWDPNLAGVIQVWRDPADGLTYVVNGHNRVALAKRAGVDRMAVQYLEADTAHAARAAGALANIAEGRGTLLDAAKFFRDSGLSAEDLRRRGMPLREQYAREGLALANLGAPIFRRVVTGELPTARAVLVGERVPSPDDQLALVRLLDQRAKRGQKINEAAVAELADLVGNAPTRTEVQETLFGVDERTQRLALEKAKLLADLRERLSQDKRLFRTVSRAPAAARLAQEGTVVDIARGERVGQEAAELLAVFDRVKHQAGPISDLVNAGVQRIGAGENRHAVMAATYQALRNALPAALRGREGPSRAGGPADRAPIGGGRAAPTPEARPPRDLTDALAGEPELAGVGAATPRGPAGPATMPIGLERDGPTEWYSFPVGGAWAPVRTVATLPIAEAFRGVELFGRQRRQEQAALVARNFGNPSPSEPGNMLVYRLGSARASGVEGRTGANAAGLVYFAERAEMKELQAGNHVSLYEIRPLAPLGKYTALRGAFRQAADQAQAQAQSGGISVSAMPSERRKAAEAGGPAMAAPTLPPGTQPSVPPAQISARAEPSGSATTRTTEPFQRVGPKSTSAIAAPPFTEYQQIQDAASLRRLAQEDESSYRAELAQAAASIPGARLKGVRVKTEASLEDKLGRGAPAAAMTDYLGGRIAIESPAAMTRALAELPRRFEVVEADDFLEGPRKGYRAVHLAIRRPNGLVTELQLVPEEIGRVQDGPNGWATYARWRGKSSLTPEERAQAVAEQAASQSDYQRAYDTWRAKAEPRFEPTPEGLQGIIPGAERRAIPPGPIRRPTTAPPLESTRAPETLFNRERLAGERDRQMDLVAGPPELGGVGAASARQAPPEERVTPPTTEGAAAEARVLTWTGRSGNILLDKIHAADIRTTEEARRMIDLIGQEYERNIEAERTPRPWSQVQVEANRLTLERLLGRQVGEAFNDTQLQATMDLLATGAERLANVRTRYRAEMRERGTPSRELRGEFHDAVLQLAALQQAATGARATAGRALGILRQRAQAREEALYHEAIRRISRMEQPHFDRAMEVFSELDPQDPVAINRFIRDWATAPNIWRWLEEYRVAAMLSSPSTHLKIIGSEASILAALPVERWATAGTDRVRAWLTGTPQERYAGEVLAGLTGLAQGRPMTDVERLLRGELEAGAGPSPRPGEPGLPPPFRRPVRGAEAAGMTGLSFALWKAGRAYALDAMDPTAPMWRRGAIPGRTGETIRTPLRAHAAEDAFFRTLAEGFEYYSQAYRIAKGEGLQGDAFARRYTGLLDHPTDAMLAAMRAQGQATSLNAPMGPWMETLMRMRGTSQLFHWIVPFAYKATNIAKAGMARSPIQFVPARVGPMKTVAYKILKGELGGGEASEAVARAAVGTVLMAGVAMLAHQGLVTGGGPENRAVKAELMDAGWRPYSLVLGDTYLPFRAYEPWGGMLGGVADAVDLLRDGAPESKRQNALTAALEAYLRSLTSPTYLTSLTEALDYVARPAHGTERFLQAQAGTYVPNALARLARGLDPIQRETQALEPGVGSALQGLVNSVVARLPLASMTLEPKLSALGQPRQWPEGMLQSLLNPSPWSTRRAERWLEGRLAALSIGVGAPAKRWTIRGESIALTTAEYRQFNQRAGEILREPLIELLSDMSFYQRPDDEQRHLVHQAIHRARHQARQELEGDVRERAGGQRAVP